MVKRKTPEDSSSSRGKAQTSKKGKKIAEPQKLVIPRFIDWAFFARDKFGLKDLFEYQGWIDFLQIQRPVFEHLVREFYETIRPAEKASDSFSVALLGNQYVVSLGMLAEAYQIPNEGMRIGIQPADGSKVDESKAKKEIKLGSDSKLWETVSASNLDFPERIVHRFLTHFLAPRLGSLDNVSSVDRCILWHILNKKRINLCYILCFYFLGISSQRSNRGLPYGMLLTVLFEYLGVDFKGIMFKDVPRENWIDRRFVVGLIKARKKNNTYSGEYDDVLQLDEDEQEESESEQEAAETSESSEEEIEINMTELVAEAMKQSGSSTVKMSIFDRLKEEKVEAEKKRRKEEKERKKEEEKKRKEEEKKKRAEERKRKEEEERKRKEEEERKRKEEEERKRKEAEERKRMEEVERKRKEEVERKMKAEVERKRRAEEEKRKREAEKKKKEEEELRKTLALIAQEKEAEKQKEDLRKKKEAPKQKAAQVQHRTGYKAKLRDPRIKTISRKGAGERVQIEVSDESEPAEGREEACLRSKEKNKNEKVTFLLDGVVYSRQEIDRILDREELGDQQIKVTVKNNTDALQAEFEKTKIKLQTQLDMAVVHFQTAMQALLRYGQEEMDRLKLRMSSAMPPVFSEIGSSSKPAEAEKEKAPQGEPVPSEKTAEEIIAETLRDINQEEQRSETEAIPTLVVETTTVETEVVAPISKLPESQAPQTQAPPTQAQTEAEPEKDTESGSADEEEDEADSSIDDSSHSSDQLSDSRTQTSDSPSL